MNTTLPAVMEMAATDVLGFVMVMQAQIQLNQYSTNNNVKEQL
jgi:hypothetical protein